MQKTLITQTDLFLTSEDFNHKKLCTLDETESLLDWEEREAVKQYLLIENWQTKLSTIKFIQKFTAWYLVQAVRCTTIDELVPGLVIR